jgi:arsenate reductase-like glutaredoxin family protein
MACTKARGFLGKSAIAATETVDARKVRYEGADALGLLDGIDTLLAARGKAAMKLDLKKDRPADDVLLSYLLGPSGNLRAPTARIGKTLIVGFNEETYRRAFGV